MNLTEYPSKMEQAKEKNEKHGWWIKESKDLTRWRNESE